VKIVDKKKFQLEFFTQFVEEKKLQEKWNSFKDENTFELAKYAEWSFHPQIGP